ncbi:MAG: Unknown protein [uncultured Sulfurovum sp.]|uniref:Zinc-ribbon domain-containing protein n=1 Tax=uncultured Sulfurovum sp. TaxID=269237 RepID=A0A6S6U446_9BACT|nr:MAG: Unknown protein [uncultured Sulfurovum sp.]
MKILLIIIFLLIFYIWLWKKLINAEEVYLESQICQACNHKNINEAIFCANCGKKITQKVEKKQGILITIGLGLLFNALSSAFITVVWELYSYHQVLRRFQDYFYYNYYYSYFIDSHTLLSLALVLTGRYLLIKNEKYSFKRLSLLTLTITFWFNLLYFFTLFI